MSIRINTIILRPERLALTVYLGIAATVATLLLSQGVRRPEMMMASLDEQVTTTGSISSLPPRP